MNKLISPFNYQGKLKVNSSKSYAQRAFILALLAEGETMIYNSGQSNDVLAIQKCICQLGAQILPFKNGLKIIPPASKCIKNVSLNVGESGLALRLLGIVSILFSQNITLTGEGSILNRSQKQLIEIIEQLGLAIKHNNFKLPIQITGSITERKLEIDASGGSQVISGLLLTLPLMEKNSLITLKKITSLPYLLMTLEIMSDFGIYIKPKLDEEISIKGKQNYRGCSYFVEGDWSGAANHCVGAAISGSIELHGLNPNSQQADRAILSVLSQFGANILISTLPNNTTQIITITESIVKNPFEFDLINAPDLFPILAILAASAKGKSLIMGTNRLVNKESNRLESVVKMLTDFSVEFEVGENQIAIFGTGKITPVNPINSFNDHRIAMAATIGACVSDISISLFETDCVNKSYTEFFNDLSI